MAMALLVGLSIAISPVASAATTNPAAVIKCAGGSYEIPGVETG